MSQFEISVYVGNQFMISSINLDITILARRIWTTNEQNVDLGGHKGEE